MGCFVVITIRICAWGETFKILINVRFLDYRLHWLRLCRGYSSHYWLRDFFLHLSIFISLIFGWICIHCFSWIDGCFIVVCNDIDLLAHDRHRTNGGLSLRRLSHIIWRVRLYSCCWTFISGCFTSNIFRRIFIVFLSPKFAGTLRFT